MWQQRHVGLLVFLGAVAACDRAPSSEAPPALSAAAAAAVPPAPVAAGPSAAPQSEPEPEPARPLLSAELADKMKQHYLDRLRKGYAKAAAACKQGAGKKGVQPFPANLAKDFSSQNDLVAARIECGSGVAIEPWKVYFKAAHSRVNPKTGVSIMGVTGTGWPVDGGVTFWIDQPSTYDEAPDVVDLKLKSDDTTFGLTLRTDVIPPFVPSRTSVELAARVRELKVAHGAKLEAVVGALESDCSAAVGKLPPALLEPFRQDKAVLALKVSCLDLSNSGTRFTLYQAPGFKPETIKTPRSITAEGVHGPDTLYTYESPSHLGSGYDLELQRHVPKGSIKALLALTQTP